MTKVRELERRLRDEPDNLGLRVALAAALREADRLPEAIELYRSVAVAYRDQGRTQQALAVCRSILELAPRDPGSLALVDTLQPPRRSSSEVTPLPSPLPHHVADPTTGSLQKLSSPDLTGMANAARRISASLIGGDDLDEHPITAPFERPSEPTEPEPPPLEEPTAVPGEDELTEPRELPRRR